MDWRNFLLGIGYSAVPEHWWRSWRPSSTVDFVQSAVLSGLLELAASSFLLAREYFHFLAVRAQQLEAAAGANQGTQLYFFVLVSIEYVFRPLSLILVGLAADGVLRSWAAFFTDEVVPSLPLRLISGLRKWAAARRREKALISAAPDLIERLEGASYHLRICSQFPKEGWRIPVTIAFEDGLYEIAEAKTVTGSHPFVYLVRALPAGAVVRGLQRYDPRGHS